MPQGLQVWDGQGAIVSDTSTIAGRVIAVLSISQPGSYASSEFSTGTPTWLFQPTNYVSLYAPNITYGNNTLTWSTGNGSFEGLLLIGVR